MAKHPELVVFLVFEKFEIDYDELRMRHDSVSFEANRLVRQDIVL
jgi:hypothetical protein